MDISHCKINNVWKCPNEYCPLTFRDRADLVLHVNHDMYHSNNSNIRCSKCPKRFLSRVQWFNHAKTCEGLMELCEKQKMPFQCKDCGLNFTSTKLLVMHFQNYCKEKDKSKDTVFTTNLLEKSTTVFMEPNSPKEAHGDKANERRRSFHSSYLVNIPTRTYSVDIPKKIGADFAYNKVTKVEPPASQHFESGDAMVADNPIQEEGDEDWIEIIELNEEEVDCFAINTAVTLKDEPIEQEESGISPTVVEHELSGQTIKTEIKEEPHDFEDAQNSSFFNFEIKTEDSFETKNEPQDSHSELPACIKIEILEDNDS